MSSGGAEIMGELLPIVAEGVKVLARTTLGMIVLAVFLLFGSYFLAGGGWPGVVALLLTVGLCAVGTGMVAIKRAVLSVVRAAIQKVRLGDRVIGLLFARMPSTVEKVPLRQAENMLGGAVKGLLEERAAQSGFRAWVARKAQERALELAARVTLAEIRSADHDGVDLGLLKEKLLQTINTQLQARIDATMTSVTAMICVGLTFISLGGSYFMSVLIHR